MKKLSIIIALVILLPILSHSQETLQVPTLYRLRDSTLVINTKIFSLDLPLKVRFNDSNAVLFNEAQMDSVNLKYLRFNFLYGITKNYESRLELFRSQLKESKLQVDIYKTDNDHLKALNLKTESQLKTNDKIHQNEVLYYKEKAKGKFTSFLLGTSIGALIAVILTSI